MYYVGRDEEITPKNFAALIYKPLMTRLQTHFGADPDDPAACRIKCIVLCYGIPVRITDSVRQCSVDSALTMLFEHAPWGRAAKQMIAQEPEVCYNEAATHNLPCPISPKGGYAS